jgi:quercetin dioxygenase-like cupin family protein
MSTTTDSTSVTFRPAARFLRVPTTSEEKHDDCPFDYRQRGAPWKVAIATRVTYEPGARVRKHYHTSQVVFYILEGAMVVQEEG